MRGNFWAMSQMRRFVDDPEGVTKMRMAPIIHYLAKDSDSCLSMEQKVHIRIRFILLDYVNLL